MEPTSQWIVLAHILRPQGRKGELLADLFTDFPERFDRHPQVWLAAQGFADRADGDSASIEPAEVVSHWRPVGRNAGRIVLRFAGVDSIEQAERLAGRDVLVPLSERLPLDPGAAYISDLIGCTVYDRGIALGVVDGVHFATSPDGSRRCSRSSRLRARRSWCHSPAHFCLSSMLRGGPSAWRCPKAWPRSMPGASQPRATEFYSDQNRNETPVVRIG
jgi:16S rRNA processing protein RimM